MHDLLLRLGDLTRDEIGARAATEFGRRPFAELVAARRAIELTIAGEPRLVAVEDAARYRDALGMPLPAGLAGALLEPGARCARRSCSAAYARTHGRFPRSDVGARFGLPLPSIEAALARLRRPAASSKARSVPAGAGASGATPTCCASSADDRSRGCGRRSSRSRRRCSAGS